MTYADKEGVGTAYAISSRIWFTLLKGVLTEMYYPTGDRPQVRDLQYLITDGSSFFHEERRHLRTRTERIAPQALGYRVTNQDPDGRYTIVKEIIADPHYPCVLQQTRLEGDRALLSRLRLYALCAPHLAGGGWDNSAYVVEVAGRTILTAGYSLGIPRQGHRRRRFSGVGPVWDPQTGRPGDRGLPAGR